MSTVRIGHVTRAELDKLRTLPLTTLTAAGTILTGVALGLALVVLGDRPPATVLDGTAPAIPFVQGGLVLLGILPVAQEYAGRQIHTTLAAVPQRRLLVAAKSGAGALVLVLVAALTVAATATAVLVIGRISEADLPVGDRPAVRLAGMVGHLVLVGLLSHAVALLVRHLVPALVGMLSLVLIAAPVLAAVTEHARWLPDRAAALLHADTDSVLSAGTGSLVALGWITLVGGVALARFVRADP